MKKVLIITYYWIPSGGAGVQRWVKFVKYLREFGWEPIIYTPSNPEFPSEDFSFQKDIPADVQIIKTPIWEPYDIYRKLFGKKGEKINAGFISENKKSGWKEKLSIWIRGNFLIPDPRCFWIKPSVKFLTNFLQSNPVDAIITTGPPHSMHLIGRGIKKNIPEVKWLADFRDPWTNIDFYKELNLTTIADNIHHRKERMVIREADAVVVVSGEMKKEFSALGAKQTILISNGFDTDDMPAAALQTDDKFTISHIGTLNAARNPISLWKTLSELIAENETFRKDLSIQLIGKVDFSVLDEIARCNLNENLIKINYLSHSEAIKKQHTSQLLLLLINNTPNAKGILTGKFYEYLASGRPIMAIGPTDGDIATVLHDTKSGRIADFDDEATIKKIILEYYEKYKSGINKVSVKGIEKYSRKNLTKELSQLIERLTN